MRVVAVFAFAAASSFLCLTPASGDALPQTLPMPSHTVVVVMENHSFPQIIDTPEASFFQHLAQHGAVFIQSFAVAHPSQPNYFALFSGSTHDVTDNGIHAIDAPTLAGALRRSGKTFVGYVENGSPRKHNPWESFRDSQGVERGLDEFPRDFAELPSVSFVIPNQENDMHDGSVGQGDAWLRQKLGRYADWCVDHNSLLIVTFDEDDGGAQNRIATIFVGENVVPGYYDLQINHYGVLRTILAMYGLEPLGQSALEKPITGIWRVK